MSTQAKFFFTGNSDQFTKALSQVKKSMKQVATQTVVLQAGLKLLSATIKTVAKTLTSVLGAAVKGIVNLISAAIRTIKNLITGVVKFVKSALTTLLSWITKALGKVFDWIGNMFKAMGKVAAKTVDIAKKTIKQIAQSVQAYADKEYNQIQLKVSLGDSYDSVIKDFNKLVRYTTADRNELLSVYATFAELGKKPEEVAKYAKATVYLSNATGRSLSQITRLLLGQEAAGRDLEKVLGRIGITLTGNEESVSNVEKIISQLDDEMQALATGSLNQVFANIKNDIIAIRENIGYIFSGPIRYVAQKIEGLLNKLAGSNKIEGLANKLNSWFDKIKPFIDKVFDIVEKIMQDPEGFLKALWSDIKTIFNNIRKNIWNYLNVLGYILGKGVEKLGEAIGNINWTGIKDALNYFGDQAKALVLSFGKGLGLWTQEDIDSAQGSFRLMFIQAWNNAHPNFQLSEEDGWFKTLTSLLSEGASVLWNKITSWVTEHWTQIVNTIDLIATTLATAIYNAIIDSPIIDLINMIPGVNLGRASKVSEYQKTVFNGLANLAYGENGDTFASKLGLTSPEQLTKEWLNAPSILGPKYGKTNQDALVNIFSIQRTNGANMALTAAGAVVGAVATGGAGLVATGLAAGAGGFLGNGIAQGLTNGYTNPINYKETLDALNALKQYDHILVSKDYPDILDTLRDIWTNTDDMAKSLTSDTSIQGNQPLIADEVSKSVQEAAESVIEVTDAMQEELNKRKNQIESSRPNLVFPGPKPGASILDIPGIPHYGPGGPVNGPTLAVLGEEGPEFVLSNDMLTGHKRTTGGGGINVIDGAFLSQSGKWIADTAVNRILESLGIIEALDLIDEDLKVINKNTSELYSFFTGPRGRTTGGGGINNNPDMYLDENGVWQLKSDFQKFVENSKIGAFLQLQAKILLKVSKGVQAIFSKKFWSDAWDTIKAPFTRDFWNNVGKKIADKEEYHWYDIIEGIGNIIDKGLTKFFKTSFGGVGFLAQNGAFGSHIGNIYSNSFDEDGKFSILQMFSAIIQELIPYLQKGLEIIGPLFDQAFEILGNAVQILGERLGKTLLPILEAFVPFMKTLADIVIALAPVVESVLAPAIKIIAAILQILTGVLNKLMPVFAFLGATIQWISERIEYAIAGVINWLASWIPWVSSVEQKKPKSWQENYDSIMGTYNASKANTIGTPTTSSVGTASATASYNGATTVYMTNDFSGAYVVGSNGFRELALIIKNTLEDIDYSGQSV